MLFIQDTKEKIVECPSFFSPLLPRTHVTLSFFIPVRSSRQSRDRASKDSFLLPSTIHPRRLRRRERKKLLLFHSHLLLPQYTVLLYCIRCQSTVEEREKGGIDILTSLSLFFSSSSFSLALRRVATFVRGQAVLVCREREGVSDSPLLIPPSRRLRI